MKLFFYILVVILISWNCKKEIGPQSILPAGTGTGELLVINEGNFGFGNASVSVLNSESGTISNNQYRTINGVGIGDVLQSVKKYRGKYYFVVNNSGKVVVTDTALKLLYEIQGFNSPRYIEFYGNKAFVSDLKQGGVYVVDLTTNRIVNQINTRGWTEELMLVDSKLLVLDKGGYLTNSDSNFVFIIDPDSETKIDSLKIGRNPNSMEVDNLHNLWVLSSGMSGVESPSLTQYNLSSMNHLFQLQFHSSSRPSSLCFYPVNNRFYFLNNSIYSIHSDGSESSPQILYQQTTENFYGLDVIRGKLYATNAKNYNQTGEVNILTLTGISLHIVSASLIPSMVCEK
jgi:YVTN family beta-propeller protein